MKTKREPWFWIFVGTAVVMLCAIGIFIWSVLQSRREGGRMTASGFNSGSEVLGRFNPPAYRSFVSSSQPAGFANGIERYSKRDYAAAIPVLDRVVKDHPDFFEARFYLGICYLFRGDRPSGIAQLRSVIAAGNTPYLEQARYYLAKGLLGAGDVVGARQQLDDIIVMHGEMEQQAESLLVRLK